MEQEIEGERAEVEESCKKTPVLWRWKKKKEGVLAFGKQEMRVTGGTKASYLPFYPYCLKADEELKWGEDVALTEDGCRYNGCGPPPGYHRDIIKPLFQGCSHRRM